MSVDGGPPSVVRLRLGIGVMHLDGGTSAWEDAEHPPSIRWAFAGVVSNGRRMCRKNVNTHAYEVRVHAPTAVAPTPLILLILSRSIQA